MAGSTPDGGQSTPFEWASLSLRSLPGWALPTVALSPVGVQPCAVVFGVAEFVWAAATPTPSENRTTEASVIDRVIVASPFLACA